MGIWDLTSWSIDSVKGLWHSSYQHGSSVITKGKEFSADTLQKVNHYGSAAITKGKEVSYDALLKVNHQGSAAITKGKEVSFDALLKVNHHLSDPRTRTKISRVATNAALEGLRFVPGGSVTYKIISSSIYDDDDDDDDMKLITENQSKKQEEDFKTLQARVSKLEEDVDVLRQQLAKQAVETKPLNTVRSKI